MSFSRDGLGPQRRKPAIRSKGESPTMGHVARMHRNSTRTEGIGGYAGRIPKVLFVAALLLFAGTITGVVLWASSTRSAGRPQLAHLPAPTAAPADSKFLVPAPAVLEETVTRMLAARTPAQLAPLIRGSNQRPETIVAKLSHAGEKDGKLRSVRYRNPIDSRCLQLESVLVTFADGSDRVALLAPDEEKNWRVDFDAYDRYVSPDWDTLLAGKGTEGTIRVKVVPEAYYNGPYADDKKWACFGLASPDLDTILFGYALRRSPQQEAIAGALRRNVQGSTTRMQRMTLEIRHTGTGDPRQFEITRVLSDDWALGDKPLDSYEEEKEPQVMGSPLEPGR